jgi:EAL domain-containing protein (putative c-di-GMP-specific phosphodiesterase class I)
MSVHFPVVRLPGRMSGRARVSPFGLLALGGAVVSVSALGMVFTGRDLGNTLDSGQQAAAAAAAVAALLLGARSGQPDRRFVAGGLILTIGCAGLGMLAWDLQPQEIRASTRLEDCLFLMAVLILLATLLRAIFGGLSRTRLGEVALDSAILLVASVTLLGTIWATQVDPAGRDQQAAVALCGALVVIAGPAAAALALLRLGLAPRFRGPYAVLGGVALVGVAWLTWLMMLATNLGGEAVATTDFGYSAGLLICAYGGVTWSLVPSPTPRSRLTQIGIDAFPLCAVAVCVALDMTVPRTGPIDAVRIGTAGVVALALLRQMLLTTAERRARLAERAASAYLETEIRTRAAVLQSLSRLEQADTIEETADRICSQALLVDGIDSALILAFSADGGSTVIAFTGVGGAERRVGTRLAPSVTARYASHAADGPWTVAFEPSADPLVADLYDAGLRIAANAPLVWNDGIVGAIGLGTVQEPGSSLISERLSTAREFGVVAGALLGNLLAERGRLEAVQQTLAGVIDQAAFHPVFQAIVDLTSGRTIGYEALTRFHDGKRPDLWFADAAAVGLELELELATLRAARRDAAFLPPGACLSVNASPGLSAAFPQLIEVIECGDREIILEVTEHAPVTSYVGLTAALEGVRHRVRVAVDDAGAGYAGLQHILEIKPDIVKLDIALVRAVDKDRARRALIASIVTFARETGCTVLAEGIETEEEMEVCQGLGVTLGQGYLFARPETIDVIRGEVGTPAVLSPAAVAATVERRSAGRRRPAA